MRTKTLLLTASIAAMGIASSMGQVFSENAVGYYVRELAPGFNLIANQLNNGDNKITTLMPDGQEGLNNATLFKWDTANQTFFDAQTYFNGAGWLNESLTGESEATLDPGEAAFLLVEAATSVTFVGEVPQGDLSVPISVNFSLISQPTPQALALDAEGNAVPAGDDDIIFFWDAGAQGFEGAKTYFGVWLEDDFATIADLSVSVGEGFFYQRSSNNGAVSWDRTFNVN